MNLYDVFDSVGIDGIDNKNAFDKLPVQLRYFIDSTQRQIVDRVKKKVEDLYGKDGIRDLVKTSGFRSIKTNTRCGGVADSLHLFGCAVDFAKKGIFKDKFIPLCCNLELIDSGACWHVQLKRGGK